LPVTFEVEEDLIVSKPGPLRELNDGEPKSFLAGDLMKAVESHAALLEQDKLLNFLTSVQDGAAGDQQLEVEIADELHDEVH